ncbi:MULTISPECIES: V-type ATPase subunit [Dethiosulfovibrio]|nr:MULTISPECIES: V-type ATPase subunit [Dethiosulfovibrio]MCF4113694.1 V-type ATPase subunit [Dethiosulfovibrio russensis]
MAPAERYGYLVARLRAMENRLLDESLFQRLIECDGLDGAIKVLGETVYAPWIMEMKSNEEFDSAIEAELHLAYDEISRFTPDEELVQLCRLPYDFHNVKVLVKSLILSKEGGDRRFDLLTSLGTIDTDSLVMAVESEEYRLLPFGLHRTIPQVLTHWDQNHDMLAVECALDRCLFKAMSDLVGKLSMPQVNLWFKRRVDAENVRTLIRLSRAQVEPSAAVDFLHKGGDISIDRLISTLAEPIESWGRLLAFADVGTVFDYIQDASDMETLLMVFDKILDDYVTDVLEEAKYGCFEPENVLRFSWLKELEAKNLRVILVSIANGADRDMVRRLMRRVG